MKFFKNMQFKMNSKFSIVFVCLMSFYLVQCTSFDDDDDVEMELDDSHSRRHSNRRFWRDVDSEISDLIKDGSRENFLMIDFLADGELERRISYNGLTAKETSVGYNTSKTLTLWQVTNGYGFIQLIYTNLGELIDCEYVRQKYAIHAFLTKFNKEYNEARVRNFTSRPVPRNRSPLTSNHEFNQFLTDDIIPEDYTDLQELTVVPDEEMRNLTYRHIENINDVPNDMKPWLNFNDLKRQCHQRHRQMKKIVQGLSSKDKDIKKTASEHLERHRRDLSNLLRVPGTKWCGKGWSASKYSDLGGYSKADRCCRQHDKSCPYWIMGLETKYNLFNWRVSTLMHCKCDERFRTCLKMADSSDANMVGKLFFNIMGTKCFVLKPEKVCKKRSWWGDKCEKRAVRKRAILRDNRRF